MGREPTFICMGDLYLDQGINTLYFPVYLEILEAVVQQPQM
jgi:hypothetical protein